MRRTLALVLVLGGCLVSFAARAEDAGADAGAKLSDAEYCKRTRPPRVKAVQIRTREWLKRLADMRVACTVAWVKTGGFTVNGNRITPDLKGDVKCPKGPPPGETKESVWNALSLFLEPAPMTDEVMTIGPVGPDQDTTVDDSNVRCTAVDAAGGLVLRPLVNDEPALRRILAWKPD